MATIIQNMACFEVEINAQNQRIYFDEDILRGKKINQIFFFSAFRTGVFSPFQSPDFESIDQNDFAFFAQRFGAYFNLYHPDGSQLCKNLFVENINVSLGVVDRFRQNFIELDVRQFLDTKKSYLSVFLDTPARDVMKALVLVTYENRPIRMQDITITGSKTIEFPQQGYEPINPPIVQDFKLSDFAGRELSGKPIKKIQIENNPGGYLYLKTRNGLIEYLPLSLLNLVMTKEFYFDNLLIDFEKSFLLRRSIGAERVPRQTRLTFFY